MLTQIFYSLLWLFVWLTQRIIEFKIVKERALHRKVSKWQFILLIVLNFFELFLELALYIALIRIICLFMEYLSYIKQKDAKNAHKIKNDIRRVRFFSVVIVATMITATLLQTGSPWLYLSDTF